MNTLIPNENPKANKPNNPNYQSEIANFFSDNPELFKRLVNLNNQKQEIKMLHNTYGKLKTPIVVTISGTPRAGKTTCVDNLTEFFRKANFTVSSLAEPAGIIYSTLKSREEKQELLKDRIGFVEQQYSIGSKDINLALSSDIIICDRGILDTFIWIKMYYNLGMISTKRYLEFLNKFQNHPKYLNCFYGLTTTSETAMKRDYINSLSIEPRSTMSKDNVERYNTALQELVPKFKENCHTVEIIDTTDLDRLDASIIVANDVIKRIRKQY